MENKSDIANYITIAIARSGKSNMQIAKEAGFPNQNIISMIKKGHTQVPLARIPALATAIGTDPKVLLDGCLAAYQPELHRMMSSLAPSMLISSGELTIIRFLRRAMKMAAIA